MAGNHKLDSGGHQKALEELRKTISNDAIEAVTKKFPPKVIEIEELMKAVGQVLKARKTELPTEEELKEYAARVAASKAKRSDNDSELPVGKKRKISKDRDQPQRDGVPVVYPNKDIGDIMRIITTKLTEGVELLGLVKTWVQLNIPKIEDGNNFGVGVQEECLSELSRVEDAGYTQLDSISNYFQTRATWAHKMAKHPLIADYRQAVVELDHTQYIEMRMTLADIR
mmetsp:Transcript_43947/g.70328  ORF Transcript_43947/g.70328 Transcript_43947/m.70328 type:complete len:227 (+) Transcript_43947:196-876(+)